MNDEHIREKLNRLADLQAQKDAIRLRKQELIDNILTPDIKQQIADIETEFATTFASIDTGLIMLESEIKTDVLEYGSSVKGQHLRALWTRGRVSWDTRALDGYAVAHPEILPMRKSGDPSVSIRDVR